MTASTLIHLITETYPKLLQIHEADSVKPLAPGKWSRKQLLGHLIDSASNNHQRFVRVQVADGLSMPSYGQQQWIRSQHYQDEPWLELLAFWRSYNLHLTHVIAHIPEETLNNRVTVGDDEPTTLRFLVEDYDRHLKHHLEQILS